MCFNYFGVFMFASVGSSDQNVCLLKKKHLKSCPNKNVSMDEKTVEMHLSQKSNIRFLNSNHFECFLIVFGF